MGKQKKVTVKVKAEPKKKPIKPKMGRGTGGVLTAKVIALAKEKNNG